MQEAEQPRVLDQAQEAPQVAPGIGLPGEVDAVGGGGVPGPGDGQQHGVAAVPAQGGEAPLPALGRVGGGAEAPGPQQQGAVLQVVEAVGPGQSHERSLLNRRIMRPRDGSACPPGTPSPGAPGPPPESSELGAPAEVERAQRATSSGVQQSERLGKGWERRAHTGRRPSRGGPVALEGRRDARRIRAPSTKTRSGDGNDEGLRARGHPQRRVAFAHGQRQDVAGRGDAVRLRRDQPPGAGRRRHHHLGLRPGRAAPGDVRQPDPAAPGVAGRQDQPGGHPGVRRLRGGDRRHPARGGRGGAPRLRRGRPGGGHRAGLEPGPAAPPPPPGGGQPHGPGERQLRARPGAAAGAVRHRRGRRAAAHRLAGRLPGRGRPRLAPGRHVRRGRPGHAPARCRPSWRPRWSASASS